VTQLVSQSLNPCAPGRQKPHQEDEKMMRGPLLGIFGPVGPGNSQAAEKHDPGHRNGKPPERTQRQLVVDLPRHNLEQRVKWIIPHPERLSVLGRARDSDALLPTHYSCNRTRRLQPLLDEEAGF
jgi:hypothetical protein